MGRYIDTLLKIFLFAVGAGKALAYPTPVDFDGKTMRWPIDLNSAPITYEIKGDDDQDIAFFREAVDDAAGLWSQISESYFSYAPADPEQEGQVTINFKRSWAGSAHTAGFATFDKFNEQGQPTHCSITVGVTGNDVYLSTAKTILHELGHCVGLGHSLIPEAIMSYQLSKNTFALDIDDEGAATRLYPADGRRPQLPPGCAAGLPEKGSVSALWALLLLPLLSICLMSLRSRSLKFD